MQASQMGESSWNGTRRGGDGAPSAVSRRQFLQAALATAAAAGPSRTRASNAHRSARETISLNGTWKLYFDEEGRWNKSDWINDFLSSPLRPVTIAWDAMRAAMESRARDVRVPATWEEYRPNSVGEAWYWREISAPEAEGDRALRVIFNAVRYGAEVFLDGQRVALYLGGYTPFVAELTSLVKPGGRHQLAVHVVNPGGGEAGDWETLFLENIRIPQSHNFGGIWQDVDLIATSPVFIEDIFVEPRVADKTAVAHLRVQNRTSQMQAVMLTGQALLREPAHQVAGKAEQAIRLPAGQGVEVSLGIGLNPLKLWEPARPSRYRLEVNLRGATPLVADEASVDFGMREFTAQGRFFYLNGRKFMVKSTINHQSYPITVGYPPTPEFARKEIEVALKAGLNMMHIHRQVGHPWLLAWADELGLLLYQEPGGVIFDESHTLNYPGIQLLLRQLSDLVRRDRNHPALVAWGMANENTLDDTVISHMMQTTRELDPTRVVCDNSGAGRRMLLAYEKSFKPWRDFHTYPPAPIDGAVYRSLAEIGQPPQYAFQVLYGAPLPPMPEEGPQIVGEFGYGGLPDIPRAVKEFEATGKRSVEGSYWKQSLECLEWGFRKYALDSVLGSVTDFCRATEEIHAAAQAEMLQALRSNSFNSGYSVSCFHDLATWYCGMTDVFRNPKPICERLAQVNTPLFLALYADPAPAWTDREVRVRCTVINEDVIKGSARLRIRVVGPRGEELWDETSVLALDPRKSHVAVGFDRAMKLAGPGGHYTIHAELESGGTRQAINERALFAVNRNDLRWPSRGMLIYDPNHRLLPLWVQHGVPHQEWSPTIEPNGRAIVVNEIERWYYYEHRERIRDDLRRIFEQCQAGATVSFLIGSGDDGLIELLGETRFHPSPLRLVNTAGNFRGCFHFVKPHPLFEHLPVRSCMNSEYRNVVARTSLEGFDGESIVVCNENAYWWGTDVGTVRLGKGAALLTTMRIAQNFGIDPVAEQLLANIATWEGS